MSKSEAEEMTQVLKDNGITVVEPSEELTTGLQEIGAQMLEAWKEEAGETGQQLLDAYEG